MDATESANTNVEKRLVAVEFARGSIAHLAPDRNLADELIADRRAEQAAPDVLRLGSESRPLNWLRRWKG